MIDPALVQKVSEWWNDPRGWCYVASEAIYYLSGGKTTGIKAMQGSLELDGLHLSHWWLVDEDGTIVDPTADQFDFEWPYNEGWGRGFQTNMKNDTKDLIEWLHNEGF